MQKQLSVDLRVSLSNPHANQSAHSAHGQSTYISETEQTNIDTFGLHGKTSVHHVPVSATLSKCTILSQSSKGRSSAVSSLACPKIIQNLSV